jgi:hypothetical protein
MSLHVGENVCLGFQVKGKRLDTEGVIRTRSRAAAQAEEWQIVSAPTKIVMLLADMLIEACEGQAPCSPWVDSIAVQCINDKIHSVLHCQKTWLGWDRDV